MTIRKLSAKKLKKLGGKMPWSTVTAPKKAFPKSNPRQQAKRKAGYRKLLSGKEYKAARAEAMKRARGQCEEVEVFSNLTGGFARLNGVPMRCPFEDDLQAHHLRYPKARPLSASDLKILCLPHHEKAEAAKMHKSRMR